MKIVYCILGTFNSGGMERVLANKANYLANLGHEVNIVTTDQQGRKPYFELDPAVVHVDIGINYTENNGHSFFRKLINYFFMQRTHRQKLDGVLTKLHADICISMFDKEASFLYKIKDGSKKILEVHFSRYKRLQYGRKGIWKIIDLLQNYNDLRIAKRYDRFVVLTEEDRGYWGDLHNIQVIPNANSFVSRGVAELKNKRAIAVGRYDYQKGFDDMIQVWKFVHQHHPDWKLYIYGQGPLKEQLFLMVKELGLEHVIHLCQPVKNIEQEYLMSSMLVMTSRYEGLPMTLLEAQACGLPLIAYACKCGPRDIIRDAKNGFLLEEGDREEMANRVMSLIENPLLRQQMGGTSRVLSTNFSEEYIMRRWLSVFNEVLYK